MSIDGIRNNPLGSGRTREARDTDRPGGQERSGASRPALPRDDSVQISSVGRELASGNLDPERVDELRENIRRGRYDQPGVAEDVARRILASGDVI